MKVIFIFEGKDNVYMEIGIVGGGSIGLLVSCYLCAAHKVTIYVKRIEQKQKINDDGLYFPDSPEALSVRALLLDEMENEDCVIICVKQSHISTILTKINRHNEDTPFIFLQNGMGHINQLNKLNNKSVFIGIVEHGASREADNGVCHTGKGLIKLAAFRGEALQLGMLVKQLNQDHFPVQMATDWKQLLSEKLVINAVINPLTTLFHVKNGAILDNQYIHGIAKVLCHETTMVLDLDFLEQWSRVQTVAKNTQANTSSMLKDILTQQQTENEAISGYIIEQCIDKTKIPNTIFVYNSVKALEMQQEMNK